MTSNENSICDGSLLTTKSQFPPLLGCCIKTGTDATTIMSCDHKLIYFKISSHNDDFTNISWSKYWQFWKWRNGFCWLYSCKHFLSCMWMSKAKLYVVKKKLQINTARHLNDQKTKSRLNPVCIEIVTLILNFIKVSNGHRVGVYLKALHEQLFALLYVLDGPNPVEECTLIDFRERFHTSQIWHSNFPLITKVYLHSAF